MNAREPRRGPGRSLRREERKELEHREGLSKDKYVAVHNVHNDFVGGENMDADHLGSTTKALNCPQGHAGERQEVQTQPSCIFGEQHDLIVALFHLWSKVLSREK